jgi:hypothetical protein
VSSLYDQDYYSWTQEQANILRRAGELRLNGPPGLDFEHLAQELWELSLSIENELYHRYVVLLCHLLKWQYQPNFRSGSWRGTIDEQRFRIARLFRKNPGLRQKRAEEFVDAYSVARRRAASETGLAENLFPDSCPFSLDEIEEESFWPL